MKKALIAAAGAAIAAEIGLRLLGFGNPVLWIKDTRCGYRLRPEQHCVILGKRSDYNRWSQRSKEVSDAPLARKLRVLIVGDSVINGGIMVDQRETIGELVGDQLSRLGKSAEVLTASAGSWALGNELGYLLEFGTLHSDVGVLEIGANDLPQPPGNSEKVGVDPDFPEHRPLSALLFCLERYAMPHLRPSREIPAAPDPVAEAARNRKYAAEILGLFRRDSMRAIVLFVPTSDNAVPPFKAGMIEAVRPLADGIIDMQEHWNPSFYLDVNHLNPSGNLAVAQLIGAHVVR